jgi:hypothetical protein
MSKIKKYTNLPKRHKSWYKGWDEKSLIKALEKSIVSTINGLEKSDKKKKKSKAAKSSSQTNLEFAIFATLSSFFSSIENANPGVYDKLQKTYFNNKWKISVNNEYGINTKTEIN